MPTNKTIGIDQCSHIERGKLYKFLSILDLCFSSFIIAPLVIAFWSSTWSIVSVIVNVGVFTDDEIVHAYVTLAFGFSISLIFTRFQKQIQAVLTEHVENKFLYFLGTRFYTYIFAFANVSTWYGIWIVVDRLTNSKLSATLAVVTISYFSLAFTRTSRNIKATPFIIATDNKENYFDAPTFFESLQHKEKSRGFLDIIFTVLIVGTLVPFIWKGMWFLLDEVLFVEDAGVSNFSSLVIGYFIVLVTYLSESLVKISVDNGTKWKGLVILDIYTFITFCGAISIWRGIWNTLVSLTNLENSLSTSILVHLTSFILLVGFNVSNVLLLRGACTEETEEFPRYFTSLLQKKKKRDVTAAQPNDAELSTNISSPMMLTYEDPIQMDAIIKKSPSKQNTLHRQRSQITTNG